jgi:hypothetical protein
MDKALSFEDTDGNRFLQNSQFRWKLIFMAKVEQDGATCKGQFRRATKKLDFPVKFLLFKQWNSAL